LNRLSRKWLWREC